MNKKKKVGHSRKKRRAKKRNYNVEMRWKSKEAKK